MRGVGLALVSLFVCTVTNARAEPKQILVVGEPGGAEAVTERGHQVVEATEVDRVLRALGDRAASAERAAVAAVTDGLARAQDLYLEQEFDEMIGVLEALATGQRALLASPEHRELGWAVAFRLGLARLSRGKRGDKKRAMDQFALALAYLFEKRPASDLYGPDVATAFSRAVAQRERLAPRPVTVQTSPAGALVVVDGFPGMSERRNLRPGLHAVRVSAPGYLTRAELVEIGESGDVPIELERDTGSGVVDRWTVASLVPGRPAFDQFWRSMMKSAGADAVLWVGNSKAVVVTGDRTLAPATGASARTAAAAALSDWLGAPPSVDTGAAPLTRRPLFWTGVAGAAALVVVGVVLLARGGGGGGGDGSGGISVGVVDP